MTLPFFVVYLLILQVLSPAASADLKMIVQRFVPAAVSSRLRWAAQ